MIGSVLSHYRILSPLGAGGMGVVYLAEDQRLGRQVAIKFLPPDATKNPQALERFHLEARAVSSLSHPGICALYDIGMHEGSPFLVMERLKGETLRARILRGALPVADVIDVGIQLAEALEAAHAQGIVHRDIKPANIWIGDKLHAKILDFGLAKLAPQGALTGGADAATDDNATMLAPRIDNPLTAPGMAIGTVLYMSPEQARGEVVDARTDVFSLGVVLYEMVTGQQAFAGSTAAVVFDAILNRAPLPPVVLNPEIPVRLQDVITSTLEKRRDDRCRSAALLEGELRRIRREVRSSGGPGRKAGIVPPDPDATAVPMTVTGPTAIVPPTALPTAAPTVAATVTAPLTPVAPSASAAPTSAGVPTATMPLPAPTPRSKVPAIAAAVVVIAAVTAWVMSERSGDGGTSATTNLVQRAQVQLEVGDVRAALVEARAVLAQDAQHPEATRIALAAEAKLSALEAALARSRDALAVNDLVAARTAFEAAQVIAPGDPVVASLADQLARTAGAAAAAPAASLASGPAVAPSTAAAPTTRDSASRASASPTASPANAAPAPAARQAVDLVPTLSAAPSPAAPVPSGAPMPPPVAAAPETRGPASEPAAPPARNEPANALSGEPRAPAVEAAPVPTRRPPVERVSDDDAVRQALQIYERAIENKDLALFKSVRPDLSGDEERRLRASFQQVERQHVELHIDALAVSGDQADVRVTRQDTVQSGGRTQTSRSTQTIRLARRGTAWIIVSLGR